MNSSEVNMLKCLLGLPDIMRRSAKEIYRLNVELAEAREAMRLATLALGGEPAIDTGVNVREVHVRDDGQICELTGEPIVIPGLGPESILESLEDEKAARRKPLAQILAEREARAATIDPIPLKILYRNHRGAVAVREVRPRYVRFAATEWHPEPQWLLEAIDVAKRAERSFAMRDILGWGEEAQADPSMPVARDEITAALADLLEHASKAFDRIVTMGGQWVGHEKSDGFQAAIERAGKALGEAEELSAE